MGNLEGLFDTVNAQVGEIAVQVGTTPAAWNAGVFSLIRQLSETVILPIAGLIQGCVVLVLSLQSCASSLITLGNAAAGAVGATTYPAQDGDMLGAEAAYCSLEAELQHYLDTYESTHDYDEYHFDLDAIEHDPYGDPISYANLNSSYWQAHFFDSLLIDNRFLTCLSRTGYAMIN